MKKTIMARFFVMLAVLAVLGCSSSQQNDHQAAQTQKTGQAGLGGETGGKGETEWGSTSDDSDGERFSPVVQRAFAL